MSRYPILRLRAERNIRDEGSKEIAAAIEWLLKRAASESDEGRRIATDRLSKLYHAGLMTGDQKVQLGDLLWQHRTASNLPDTPVFMFSGS